MSLESLETRAVMTCGTGLEDLAALFQDGLGSFSTTLDGYWNEVTLPLIGDRLGEIDSPADQVASALATAFDDLAQQFEGADPPDLETLIQDAVISALDAVHITPTELQTTCHEGGLNVYLDLSRDVPWIETAPFQFGLGPLPFFAVNADAQFDVGVGLSGLDMNFGFNEAGVYLDPGDGQYEVSLYADFTGTSFEAIVGLLAGQLRVETRPGFDHPLQVALTVDVTGAGNPITVDAGAHFDLEFEAGVNENLIQGLPSVQATIAVDWFGPGADQPAPTVAFTGVQLEFGELVSSVLVPIVEHVGPIIDKVDRVYDVLNAPIPVLKELVDPDPSTLDLLSMTADLVKSPEYQAVVKFLEVSSLISGILDTFDSDAGALVMDLGGFQLPNGLDLRDAGEATLSDLVNQTMPNLGMDLLGTTLNFQEMAQWAADNLPGSLGASVGELLLQLDSPVQVSLPLLTNPAGSLFSLLMGQDVDFFRVDVDYHGSGGFDPAISLPGLSFNFGNEITWDITVGMGLDTRGIRNFIQGVADGNLGGYHFGDGFYVTENTGVKLSAGLEAELSANLVLVHAGVEGGVKGTLLVEPEPSQAWVASPANTAAEDDKLYIRSDMGDCLGHAGGAISAYLDAWVGLGVQVPGTDIFLGGKKEFHLANKDLFSFGQLCIPNPFGAFDEALFEPATTHDAQTEADLDVIQPGELWLNVGHRANLRGYLTDQEHESILVEQLDVGGEDVIRVTFAGRSKDYANVDRIVAYGGTGADQIEIAAGVTADVCVDGGDGEDVLISHTSAVSELYGGDGDDVLEGGLGPNILDGGAGNDEVRGGEGPNEISGGAGDDLLLGGPADDLIFGDYPGSVVVGGMDTVYAGGGSDTVFGGGGNDLIFGFGDDRLEALGGDGQNVLHGDGGDDTIFAGANGDTIFGGGGSDQIHAGAGDDLIATYAEGNPMETGTWNGAYWEAGDGAATILNSPYSIDTVSLFGSPGADTFVAQDGDLLPGLDFEIAIQVPGGKSVTATNISRLNIDGLDGEDTVWLHPITHNAASPHPLQQIGVNLAEDFRDDGDLDHVVVLGTDNEDALIVDSEQVLFTDDSVCNQRIATGCRWGGVTTVSGLPHYKIYATNVMDDFQVLTGAGSDEVTIRGNPGPTRIETAGGDDAVLVTASTLGQPTPPHVPPIEADFLDTLSIDAGAGNNVLRVYESYSEISDQIHLDADTVWSQLLPEVNYLATGGRFSQLEVAGGPQYDEMYVHATHADVTETVVTGFYQPGFAGIAALDQVFVSSSGGLDGHLGDVRNRLIITGHTDNETMVHFGDRGATNGNTAVLIDGNKITGLAGDSDEAVVQMGGGLIECFLYGSDDGVLHEVFVLDGPDFPIVIHGGQGDETVVVESLQHPAIIVGEGGDDVVTVSDLAELTATLDLRGQSGIDSLTVYDGGAPAGSSYLLSDAQLQRGGSQVLFDATVDRLQLVTSSLDDQVLLTSVPPATAVQIDQGGGNNTLYGPNACNVWEVTGLNAGTLNDSIGFRGAQTLIGGDDDDHFRMAAGAKLSGKIDGGQAASADTLDYSTYLGPVTIAIVAASGKGTATGSGGFDGIEMLIGSAAETDRLVGFHGDLVWEMTAADAGVLRGDSTPIDFGSVEWLFGSGGTDRFVIHEGGSVSGQVHGGAGEDTLDYAPSTSGVVVDLMTLTATRIGSLRSIEHVVGGGGDDVLIGDPRPNRMNGGAGDDILVGNDGADLLVGGLGRDLLIGGAGQDELHGQSGDDILIGGTTVHDADVASLSAIGREWTRHDLSYKQRIDHVMTGGGHNGAAVLAAHTVLQDGAVDQLFGEADRDWFWRDPADLLDAAWGESAETAGV